MKLARGIAVLLTFAASSARADFVDHFATTEDIGLMKVPHRGEVKILVIPLIVDDQPIPIGFLENVDRFFSPIRDDELGRYYRATSLGRYNPRPVVAPAVHFATCPALGSYQGCEIPRGAGLQGGDLTAAVALVRDVIIFADEMLKCAQNGPGGRCTGGDGIDLRDFDKHGLKPGTPDGFADGVIIVTNAPLPAIALPLGWLAEHPLFANTARPLPTLTYGGIQVGALAISGPGGGRSSDEGIRVAIHEFGHLLGLADLYNEDRTTTSMPYSPMGGWYYDTDPPLMDPFSRAALGWANVEHVGGSTETYALRPSADGGKILKVGTGDEFFLVEFRAKRDKLDVDLGVNEGVIIQRVNMDRAPSKVEGYFLLNTLPKCLNCRRWEPFLMFEQADGLYDLQLKKARNDEDDVFLEGDAIYPSSDVAPRGNDHVVFSTNRFNGERTEVMIRVKSISSDRAELEIAGPEPVDACMALGRFCLDRSCSDGYCGDDPNMIYDAGVHDSGEGPPDTGVLDAGSDDTGEADAGSEPPDAGTAPDAGTPTTPAPEEGCGCRSAGSGRGEAIIFALAIAALVRRRPRKLL